MADRHHGDGDEYERAVAFLREFHSRRVAVVVHHRHPLPPSIDVVDRGLPHSPMPTLLDTIVEDDIDDAAAALSSNFALALGIGSDCGGVPLPPTPTSVSTSTWTSMSMSPSRMKKTTTTKCLFELGAKPHNAPTSVPDDAGCGDDPPAQAPASSSRCGGGESSDDYFCHDLPPSSKRGRRGWYLLF